MAHFLEAESYKKIVESVPIVCVDIILKYRGKYILVKRTNEPLRGRWWIIGGRQWKNENLKDTAKRKIAEESGLVPASMRISGIYEDSYPKSAWGTPQHSVSIVFEAIVKRYNPILDSQSSDVTLSDKLPKRFLKHYVKFI